jgi:pimeloyl-ACP methyl ester carboxylesterase
MVRKIALGAVALLVALIGIGAYLTYEPDIPRAVLEAKYATPPSRFLVLSDGTRVHYRDRGPRDVPAIVLLHGSDSSLFDWEPWSNILSDKFRVISVDLPGHGLTGATPSGDYSEAGMAKFVEVFADKLGIKQFALAGNSMGGGVAARFAETYPDRVTHLIIVDGYSAGMSVAGRLPLAYRLARIPVLNRVLLHLTPRLAVEEGLNKAVARKAVLSDDMIDRFWDFLRMEGTRPATLMRFNLKPDAYVRDHTKAITAPTLILWGADDHMLPALDARAWVKALPNSRLIIYPATGHMPMEELPEKSAADVRAFLEIH